MATVTSMVRRFYSSLRPVRAQKYVLAKHFRGEPKRSDFELQEEDLPPLKDGEFLAAAEYLSVDPYMRAYMVGKNVPTLMIGGQVAKIVESRNPLFPVGASVTGSFGWRTHTVVDPNAKSSSELPLTLVPNVQPFPSSLALGVLGMPGNTAYFGLKEVCQAKPGETLVITGAAGAVGSHVGQLAKNMDMKVIGFAGSDDKCRYLVDELGFDRAHNYKTQDPRAALRDSAPDGIDCYFDNVGGMISSIIMSRMNRYGRVAVCGSISSYNDDVTKMPQVPIPQPTIVFKELRVEGFLVWRWATASRWDEGVQANLRWLREGKLKYREHVWNGFESMPDALAGLMRGDNTGKAIVKV